MRYRHHILTLIGLVMSLGELINLISWIIGRPWWPFTSGTGVLWSWYFWAQYWWRPRIVRGDLAAHTQQAIHRRATGPVLGTHHGAGWIGNQYVGGILGIHATVVPLGVVMQISLVPPFVIPADAMVQIQGEPTSMGDTDLILTHTAPQITTPIRFQAVTPEFITAMAQIAGHVYVPAFHHSRTVVVETAGGRSEQ